MSATNLRPPRRRESGIALAIVLVLVVLMVSAVYAFSRRAVINVNITQNRLAASRADAAARGGLRLAEAIVFMIHLQEQANASGGPNGTNDGDEDDKAESVLDLMSSGAGASGDPWAQFSDVPIQLDNGDTVRLSIEEMSSRLNLNALVPQDPTNLEDTGDDDTRSSSTQPSDDLDEAVEYLVLVLRHIIEGIDAPPEETNYDARSIAENLIDYMDADETSRSGGLEDEYYRRQDPPYAPRNGPFLSFEEIALVEGVDAILLEAMRNYLTIHPIGGHNGIDLNRAEPWVLALVYAGPSGDRELLRERTLRQIMKARKDGKRICTDSSADPARCVSLADVGIDEGSIYPETILPSPVAVFRVVATAQVGQLTRRMEAIFDTRPLRKPQLLSWRRLRGPE